MMRSRYVASAACVALLVSGCVEQAAPKDYGDPSSLRAETSEGDITVQLISPASLETFRVPEVELVIAAWTKDEPLALDVRVEDGGGNESVAEARGELGPAQRFYARVPLLHGKNRIRVRIATLNGSRLRRVDYIATYDGPAPGLRAAVSAGPDPAAPCIDSVPLPHGITGKSAVCVRGQASRGASDITGVVISGESDVPATLDAEGKFEAAVNIARDVATDLRIRATDAAGRESVMTVKVVQDSTPPALTLTNPVGGSIRTDADKFDVTGTVSDAHEIASLNLVNGAGYDRRLLANPDWKADVRLEPGKNDFVVIARDIAGNEARTSLQILRDRLIRLGPPTEDSDTELNLDRRAIEELLTKDDQLAIDVVHIGLRASIVEALRAIREPESIGVNTAEWGPAEWNLHRLLNMTPDTANLKDTSIEELIKIAGGVGLPPARLLAELLSLQVTDTFVDLDIVASAVLDQLISTHPNIHRNETTGEPELRLNMYDVLQELRTLAPRFGPSGEHPGFLTGESFSAVFESGFLMSIPVTSNLKQYDGVDASLGRKDYIFHLQGENVLKFDFLSERFSVVGLVDEPTVNLRFMMHESPKFESAGNNRMASPDNNNPGFFRGNSSVWDLKPWQIERVVAETGYRSYRELYKAKSFKEVFTYSAGSIAEAAVINWDHGWVDIQTSGGIGSPPAPLYVWDMLNEVAQVRLHEGGLAEGKADVAFRLDRLPIGLTAEELTDALRPTMQSQEAKLSERIVGDRAIGASGCDFFFVPEPSGNFLYFRAASDSGGTYNYKHPGFFGDRALTTRVSSKQISGLADTEHEKAPAQEGAAYYVEDDTGAVYKLEVRKADAEGILVRIVAESGS